MGGLERGVVGCGVMSKGVWFSGVMYSEGGIMEMW